MREVFVDGNLRDIKFCKIHLGLDTIFSTKLWLKHEISAKMSFLAMFSFFQNMGKQLAESKVCTYLQDYQS